MNTRMEHMNMEALEARNSHIHHLLQEHMTFFLKVIGSYVVRMGLAHGEAVESLAMTILQETVLEALSHAERFALASQPRALFLAVAVNMLKRKRREIARQYQREPLVSSLTAQREDRAETAFFEQITRLTAPGPEHEVEAQEQVREMLSLVSKEDQRILSLAFLHDLDGQMLAKALAVPPSTARSRLHRALTRLRTAWFHHTQQGKEI